MSAKLGIIAGMGRFPILVAQGAHRQGIQVVVAALRDHADTALAAYAERFEWVSVTQVGAIADLFRREGVREVVLVGGVDKKIMFSPLALLRYPPDARALKLWYQRLKDRKDSHILATFAGDLAADGIEIVSSIKYLPESLARAGTMTRRAPTAREAADIAFGKHIVSALADLDVGQSIIVKDKVVVAVEAIEGTDETIRRGGQLAGGEAVLIKFSRTHQDMRFDVPTTGLETVRVCTAAGVSAIALEAGRVVMLDRDDMIAAADQAGIAIFGISRQ